MMFMGAMMLIVLPLFLIICVQMINKSSFAHRPIGIFLKLLFYLFALISIVGLITLIVRIIQHA